jgi:RND family efflux transporter MFP subunit
MMRSLPTRIALVALSVWLSGCAGNSAGDDDDKPDVNGQVLVTTTVPMNQTFHDTIMAWGTAVGDPHRATVISLGHGGQVTGLDVTVGEMVHRGQVLLRIAPDPAARSAYRQAQSALDLAAGELKRTEQLVTQHLATQSQLATARKALDDAQAALEAQRALGGGSQEETVAAPADGVVVVLNVNLGDRFQADAALLSFTPSRALVARLGVQPEDAPRLKPGMPLKIEGVYGIGETLSGHITMVGKAIDAQSHLLPVQADLPAGAGDSLVAGSAVRATIETASYNAWALPREAVLHDDKGDYVFAANQGHAKRIDVKVRHPEGDTVGVEGQLGSTTHVIVLGSYELDDGDAIREQQESSK